MPRISSPMKILGMNFYRMRTVSMDNSNNLKIFSLHNSIHSNNNNRITNRSNNIKIIIMSNLHYQVSCTTIILWIITTRISATTKITITTIMVIIIMVIIITTVLLIIRIKLLSRTQRFKRSKKKSIRTKLSKKMSIKLQRDTFTTGMSTDRWLKQLIQLILFLRQASIPTCLCF